MNKPQPEDWEQQIIDLWAGHLLMSDTNREKLLDIVRTHKAQWEAQAVERERKRVIMSNTRNKRLIAYIHDYYSRNGVSPTIREIMHALDYRSTRAVTYLMGPLLSCGILIHTPGKRRGISIASLTNHNK
jgi:hypothetical protein